MSSKAQVWGEYKVTVSYVNLEIDELCAILKLFDSGSLYNHGVDCLYDLSVGRDYETDCEGWSEPKGSYNIKFVVGCCGCIDKDSWIKWYSNDEVLSSYYIAEDLKEYIKSETGIE